MVSAVLDIGKCLSGLTWEETKWCTQLSFWLFVASSQLRLHRFGCPALIYPTKDGISLCGDHVLLLTHNTSIEGTSQLALLPGGVFLPHLLASREHHPFKRPCELTHFLLFLLLRRPKPGMGRHLSVSLWLSTCHGGQPRTSVVSYPWVLCMSTGMSPPKKQPNQ